MSSDFSEFYICDQCGKDGFVNSVGICEACILDIKTTKKDPSKRATRLKQINQSENGIIQSTLFHLRRENSQPDARIQSSLERKAHYEALGEINSWRAVLNAKPERLLKEREKDPALPTVVSNLDELIKHLMRRPEDIFTLNPRKFEELVSEILTDMGYEVKLTPETRDGGRDILAVENTKLGPRLTLVECKRYSKTRPVGKGIVERFLYTIRDQDKASAGLIATTSYFSPDAHAVAKKHQWQMSLADHAQLIGWLENYGNWNRTEANNIWIPNS